jgi:hypothetical protein
MSDNQNIIIMAKREDPFARVSKSMLDDERLSWRAKGVLAYLLGKPAGWKLRTADLERKSKDGGRSVRSALKELRAAGYAELKPVRSEGRIREWCWKISDTPIFSPDARFEHLENEVVENAHHSKKESSENEVSKKELSKESKESAAKLPRGVVASQDEIHEPTWKPDERTKKEKLATIKPPADFPTEKQFNAFLEYQQLDNIVCKRPNLYESLCEMKWHKWTGRAWQRIKDWERFVVRLDESMSETF